MWALLWCLAIHFLRKKCSWAPVLGGKSLLEELVGVLRRCEFPPIGMYFVSTRTGGGGCS